MADFERQYRQLEQLYGQLYGDQLTPEVVKQLQLPLQALTRAVNEQVLLAEAERLGLSVSDDELRSKILELPVFVDCPGQLHRPGQVRPAPRRQQVHRDELRSGDARQVLREKLNDVLRNGIYIGDDEVEKALPRPGREGQDPLHPAAPHPVPEAQPTPAEARSFFEAHKDGVQAARAARRRLPAGRAGPLRDQVKVSDQDLRPSTTRTRTSFKRPEQVHARHILIKIDGRVPTRRSQDTDEGVGSGSPPAPTSGRWPRRSPTTPAPSRRAATSASSGAARWSRSSRTRPSTPRSARSSARCKLAVRLPPDPGRSRSAPAAVVPFEEAKDADPRPPGLYPRAASWRRRRPRPSPRSSPRTSRRATTRWRRWPRTSRGVTSAETGSSAPRTRSPASGRHRRSTQRPLR